MKKVTFIFALLVLVLGAAIIAANSNPNKDDTHFEKHTRDNGPLPRFVIDGGPMMPPPYGFMPPFGPIMGHGPMGDEPFGGEINLTATQRDKIKDLDKNLAKDMKKLRDDEDDLREIYREKFESVLTDEQFRKVEKIRNDLRKDMKKLRKKQHDILKKHRDDFDSILTDEQKKALERKHNENHKPQEQTGAEKTGDRNGSIHKKDRFKKGDE